MEEKKNKSHYFKYSEIVELDDFFSIFTLEGLALQLSLSEIWQMRP